MIAIRPIGQRRASVRNFFSEQKISRNSALVLLAAMLVVLAGCGGGSPAGAGGGTTPPGTTPTLSLVLLDSSGATTTVLKSGAPLTVQATLIDATGAPSASTLIAFSSADTTLGVVSPASALTNAKGIATVSLNAASLSAFGASQVTATATLSGTTTPTTASTNFSVGSTTVNMAMNLLDSSGAVTTTLTAGAPLTIQATVKDAAGVPIRNTVISFAIPSADSNLAVVSPASALTNANGVATSFLNAAGTIAVGASQVTATATLVGTTTPPTASAPFAVGAATVNLALSMSPPAIPAYGSTTVAATVTLNGAPPTTPMVVQFTSGCVATGKATLTTNISTVNGVATSTYTDKGCGQTDTIVASVGSTQKTGVITVAAPQPVNIQFVGTTPNSLLTIKGTGCTVCNTSATVTFKVVDIALAGLPNRTVTFGLTTSTTSTGGITLDGAPFAIGSTVSRQTAADGTVQITVQPGTLPTSVWVTATLGTLETRSNQLVISTGRPAQDFFSLAATTLNIDGGNLDGVETTLTVRAADRMANIVTDGTTINFIAEGAQIRGQPSTGTGGTATQSTCSTLLGTCSVTLVSAEFRPRNDSEPSGLATANRVTVTAYTLGEESFVDANGNNVWDSGETWDDLGDVFVDNNENHKWELGEQSVQFSPNNTSACPPLPANGKLDWAASKSGTCDGVWGAANVRRSMVIVLSDFHARTDTPGPIKYLPMHFNCNMTFPIRLFDQYGNPMAAGTTLSLSSVNVTDSEVTTTTTCPGFSPPVTSCTIPNPQPVTVTIDGAATSTVPNTNAPGGTYHYISVTGPALCQPAVTGTFNLNVTTPISKVTTIIPYTVLGDK
jgi:hypothetical protein